VIRRTFRRGIRLGALAGIAYGVSKLLQNRREQGGAPAPWQPAPERLPAPDPVRAPVRAAPTPPPAEEPKAVEPEPEPEPEPVVEAEAEPEPEPEAAVEAEPEAAAPKGDFNLERVRPARPGTAASKTTATSKTTAKRAAVKRTSTRTSVASRAWVEPSGTTCPPSHPIKAKKPSFLYHLPGMSAYERTKPDRCYRDERSARGDGFLKAKR